MSSCHLMVSLIIQLALVLTIQCGKTFHGITTGVTWYLTCDGVDIFAELASGLLSARAFAAAMEGYCQNVPYQLLCSPASSIWFNQMDNPPATCCFLKIAEWPLCFMLSIKTLWLHYVVGIQYLRISTHIYLVELIATLDNWKLEILSVWQIGNEAA